MAMHVQIPDFDFSKFYYPQLLEALIQYKRRNVPELTDESEFEPFIQLLRAFALVGHLNNTLIDLVANESTLPTAKLVESVRQMLRLIDYELSPATPAIAELVYELSRSFATTTEVIPEGARAATERSGDSPIIQFEANEALSVTRTDLVGSAASEEAGVVTDRTADINDPLPAADFAPWATPAVGDAMYFGHPEVMWDKLGLEIPVPSSGIGGVWEFYDGDWIKTAPDLVTPGGSTITVKLNGLLGVGPVPLTNVRVTLNSTGAPEEALSQWDGSDNFVVVGLLGQAIPSSNVDDYSVGSDWSILDDVVDGTNNFTMDGDVEYAIPQSLDKNWKATTYNGVEAYWLRYRITTISMPVSPELRLATIDGGGLFVIRAATQGTSVSDDPLGSSNGLANQRFETSRDNFIKGSQAVTVDSEGWTEVRDFLASAPGSKHYVIELGENERATVLFGSGTQGKIPSIGNNNISIDYRHEAQEDGNVGPLTITVDKQGLTNVNSIFNPRQASGWKEAEGATEESLERAKVAGPASLRTKSVALGPGDVEDLAIAFVDSNGARPFSRALAIEEGLGPKTVELVMVAQGGGIAPVDTLDELETYFNGDEAASPPKLKHIVANQEVTPFNYTPKTIDVAATVYSSKATAIAIANQLQVVLRPEARADDGTFQWNFGGEVPTSRIIHEIFESDPTITKVELSIPASNVALGARELPTAGSIVITIVAS